MNISILIPSKNNPEKLNQNINKSSFEGIFKKVHYYILLDSEDEKKQYLDVIKNEDVTIINKLFAYQSQRYCYMLDLIKSDFYMIASDDIIIQQTIGDIEFNDNLKVLHAINENNYIINHPIISDKIKYKIIEIFSKYNFKYICIDTIISFMFSKNEKFHIPIKISHMKTFTNHNRYDNYIHDILLFFKVIIFKGYFIKKVNFDNFKIIYSLILDFLSANKNKFIIKLKKE